MVGLDKIINKIIDDSNAEAAVIIDRAKEDGAKILAKYAEKEKVIRSEIDENAQKRAEQIISSAKTTAVMAKKNILMDARTRLVNMAFDSAFEEILSQPDEKYLGFLTMLLTNALKDQLETERSSVLLEGRENVEKIDKYEVILNKKDAELHGAKLLLDVRRVLVGKLDSFNFDTLVLSETHAKIAGGLILRYGDIETNCSIEMLFAQKRQTLESEVYKILFA